ncbi:MAG: RNA methyltransferase, partial [Atopobium sp.]|nr:RNA methyltransferase [Atopobium sp.]
MSQELEFFATCPKGFEKLLAQELDGLRIKKIRPLGGQVAFYGSLADAYRVCLWSRLTSRVILVLDRVGAATSDALYEDLSHIAWEDHIGPHATIAVSAHGTNDQLRNTNFIAVRTKDAIVDRLAAKRGSRPMVNTLAPDVTIVVRVSRNRATVGIDLAGEALFKRSLTGGRGPAREFAPLRLDYAAALLYLQAQTAASASGFSPDAPLPALLFPGAGALAQEAAGMALDVAPGILRARWGMTGWAGHDDDAWQDLLAEADERAEKGQERQVTLYAADPRPKAKEAVLYTLRAGGLKADVQFLAASELLKHAEHFTGIVADLSWTKEEPTLQGSAYATLGLFAGQASTLLTSDTNTDTVLRATPAQTLSVYVGNSIAAMRSYPAAIAEEVEAGASNAPASNSELISVSAGPTVMVNNQPVSVLVPASDQFAARLAKVAKQR